MRRTLAFTVLAALVAVGSPRAAADVPAVTSSDASASASCQSAMQLFNPAFHATRDDAAGPPGDHVSTYDADLKTHAEDKGGPSVQGAGNINEPNVFIGPMKSDAKVEQHS